MPLSVLLTNFSSYTETQNTVLSVAAQFNIYTAYQCTNTTPCSWPALINSEVFSKCVSRSSLGVSVTGSSKTNNYKLCIVSNTLSQSSALLCIKSCQHINIFQDVKAGKPRRKTATTSFDGNKTFTVISENNTQGAADRQTDKRK